MMDFTLILKKEKGNLCYKLLKTNFYRNYYVIIVQSKTDFACGSVHLVNEDAVILFDEIVDSNTEPFALSDILADINKQMA